MKSMIVLGCIALAIFVLADCKTQEKSNTSIPAATDPLAADRAKHANNLRAQIKGREHVGVDSVFENLKVLGGFPAENLIIAMERRSEALGVSCDHCHVVYSWKSDVKPEKDVARQMVQLGETVNAELRKMNGLKSERPGVNCYTCHRGETKPARRRK